LNPSSMRARPDACSGQRCATRRHRRADARRGGCRCLASTGAAAVLPAGVEEGCRMSCASMWWSRFDAGELRDGALPESSPLTPRGSVAVAGAFPPRCPRGESPHWSSWGNGSGGAGMPRTTIQSTTAMSPRRVGVDYSRHGADPAYAR
jgi:hypothetical protein